MQSWGAFKSILAAQIYYIHADLYVVAYYIGCRAGTVAYV